MSKPYEIVIPLYDDEANLVNLLKSLAGVGVCSDDIVVSMSGPRGNITELQEKYRFRLIYSEQQQNPSITRNRGAQEVEADYIAFLDSDVLVTPEWKVALDEISANKTTSFTGDTVSISATPSWIERFWFARMRRTDRQYINGANIVVSKELFQSLEGFDETLESGEDTDFSIRAESFGVPPILDNRLKVFHEGYPSTIIDFLNRERWHASGDLKNMAVFFKSKVMIAASIYLLIIIILAMSLASSQWLIFSILVASLLILTLVLVIYKMGWYGTSTLISVVIMNLYLVGRAAALIGVLSRPLIGLVNRNKL